MKKRFALLLCALLALCPFSARAEEETDVNRYVQPMPAGASPSYEAWMAALTLPGVEEYGIYGIAYELFAQAPELMLIFDPELEREGLALLDAQLTAGVELGALAAGECLIPARFAQEQGLAPGDALLAQGAEQPLIVGGIYAGLYAEDEDYWDYVFVRREDYLNIVGPDSEDAVFVSWVLLAADADPTAYARAAEEAMRAHEMTFLTYAEYLALYTGGSDYEGALTAFDGTDLYGQALAPSLLVPGGVTMINLWATFCNPCIEEMPHLQALSEEYAARGAPFRVIGVCGDLHDYAGNLDEDAVALAQEIAKATGATYLNIIPGERLTADVLSGLQYYPTTLFVDDQGRTLHTEIGSRNQEEWRAIIEEVLAGLTP